MLKTPKRLKSSRMPPQQLFLKFQEDLPLLNRCTVGCWVSRLELCLTVKKSLYGFLRFVVGSTPSASRRCSIKRRLWQSSSLLPHPIILNAAACFDIVCISSTHKSMLKFLVEGSWAFKILRNLRWLAVRPVKHHCPPTWTARKLGQCAHAALRLLGQGSVCCSMG